MLYRVNTTGTAALETLETYDFTQLSCRSLVLHESEVHFCENPAIAYQFRPINPDLDTWHQDLCYNILPENNGALKRVNAGVVREIGAFWYEDAPHYGIQMRCLVFNNQLNVVVNSSRTDDLLRVNSQASQPTNSQWIAYGRKLDYVLPNIPSDGTIFQTLSDIAKNTGTQFSVRQNLIQFEDNAPYRAKVNGTIGTTLPFDSQNRDFPSEGYLLINKEIIQYTGRNFLEFTGLTRGVLGSEIANHADNADIIYLDNIIKGSSLNDPYKDIVIRLDTNRFYNAVQDTGGLAHPRDEMSIQRFGERTYELNLGLTRHEAPWTEFMSERYLENLNELRYLVTVKLQPSTYIKSADIISFYYANTLLIPIRVSSITYYAESTQIIGRSV